MSKAKILRANESEIVEGDWGYLTWYASSKLGNSDEMTIGKCVISPGCENPLHSHPNCTEILVVLSGSIMHLIEEGKEVELTEGDVITLPSNLTHKARNTGEKNAVLMIAFSSADRETREE
jgi:quercetin dioxygenase-like cupin family protein